MKKYLLSILLFTGTKLFAQIPEDVLKYSFFPQNGTARNLAIGGAMGSLGGDITATFVNPAGLGNYRTGEFVFTPSWFMNNNKADFRNSRLINKKNNFGIGPIGLVYGTSTNRNEPATSQAFSIAVTQTASFNNTVKYRGYNNYSSFAEQWAEEVSKSGLNFDEVYSNPQYAYGSAQALHTYLVDTFRVGGDLQVKSLPEFILESGQSLLQEKTIDTRGGIYEIGLGYAYNKKDQWLFGGSLGVPIVDYRNTTTFTESDTSSNAHNNFANFKYTDDYSTRGVGLNLKLGVIYKPKEFIRLGLAVHSPTYMISLTDKRTSSLTANTEDYNGTSAISSTTLPNGQPGESKYSMLTPWKVMISGSYVFREIQDVRKQKAFITADIEYAGYKQGGFFSTNEAPTSEELNYYKTLNKVIRQQYKGAFNFRLGGELKFNVIMARLGAAYYMNPYKDPALNANRLLLSGGLGYRNKGFFIDVTYVHSFNKDVDFAYRLQDKSNTFATVKNQRGNISLTLGTKF
ncbi:MAG: hypothetical protein IPP72_19200 [Chitinophagaceae bacterium]|nr:hypothetical protein [Chitinophagaceae bacterium]